MHILCRRHVLAQRNSCVRLQVLDQMAFNFSPVRSMVYYGVQYVARQLSWSSMQCQTTRTTPSGRLVHSVHDGTPE